MKRTGRRSGRADAAGREFSILDKRGRVLLRGGLMAESTPINPAEPGLDVRTLFVRGRNVLVARANFSELYVDYYLHLGTHGVKPAEAHDALFKRALAAFVLHCASRPWNEMTAWTINLQSPRVNLFLTGDNETGAVTGRVFDENVKEFPENLFYADVIRGKQPKRRSVVPFTEADPVVGMETFYARSEQRPVRFFQLAEEEFALVSEHPDCDTAWFATLDAEAVGKLVVGATHETVTELEKRVYRWHCGCNQDRMLEVLAPVMKQGPDELFDGAPVITIQCPRCAARHAITREALEAHVAKHP
jgi:molecular chaperone Hsp33